MIEAAKIIGTGLATTGLIGARVGIGVVFGALILGVAINLSLIGQLFSYAILGFAFAVATWLFLQLVYLQLVHGKSVSRYPWVTPQFYTDLLQSLLTRAYTSLEWCLNSPPKPHAFASLPLQSGDSLYLIELIDSNVDILIKIPNIAYIYNDILTFVKTISLEYAYDNYISIPNILSAADFHYNSMMNNYKFLINNYINNSFNVNNNVHFNNCTANVSLMIYIYLLSKFGAYIYLVKLLLFYYLFLLFNIKKKMGHRMLTLCILFALFTPVNASHNSLSLKSIYLILSIPGNLLYLTLLSLYDYNQAKIAFDYYRNRNMNINTFKSKLNILLLMGPLYLITIITGVFCTNGVWFTIKHYSNPLIFALTTIITLISAMIWHNLASKPANINNLVLNSIFRSMSELICFNSICLSTYCLWEGWTKLLSNIISLNLVYIISIIFILPYIFFSYHMIKSEIYMGPSLVYGVLYYISYTCAIMCTNGIFNLFLAHNFSNTFYLLVTIGGALITSILHPNFYRNGGYNVLLSTIIDTIGFSNLRRNNRIYIISKLIEFFILFLSFVFAAGLLYNNIQ